MREAAGPQRAGVRNLGLDDEHAVLLVDGRTQTDDVSGVESAVALYGDAHGLARAYARGVAFGNLAAEAQGVHSHNRHDGRARREVLADARLLLLDDGVEGRDDCGVGERLLGEREFRASLREKGLAVSNLLDRILILALRDLEVRLSRLVLGARGDALLDERCDALQVVAFLIENGARLTDCPGVFEPDAVVAAFGREAQTRARLLKCGVGLLHAQLVVLLLDLRDRLTATDDAPQINRDDAEATGNLDA